MGFPIVLHGRISSTQPRTSGVKPGQPWESGRGLPMDCAKAGCQLDKIQREFGVTGHILGDRRTFPERSLECRSIPWSLRRNNFGMVSEFTCPEIKGLQRRTSSEIVGYFKGRSKLQASEQASVVSAWWELSGFSQITQKGQTKKTLKTTAGTWKYLLEKEKHLQTTKLQGCIPKFRAFKHMFVIFFIRGRLNSHNFDADR